MKSSLSLKSLNIPHRRLHPQPKFQKYRLKEEALNNKLFESVAFLPNDDPIYKDDFVYLKKCCPCEKKARAS